MTIRFILNGEDVEVLAEANKRLIAILREDFALVGAKCGCLSGVCGACSVLVNGAWTAACLIPAFRARGSEVVTIEGFSQTDEYRDIESGFAAAGVETCGYCDAGRVFAAESLLSKNTRPDRDAFFAAFNGIRCRCTESESLYAGVLAAGEARSRRIYGRSS